MNVRLWFAPLWVRMIFFGVLFGLIMSALFLVADLLDWRAQAEVSTDGHVWAIGVPIAAIIFGILAPLAAKKNTAALAATIADLTPAQRVVAYRASVRGPVPDDPAVRSSALRLGETNLDLRKKRGNWLYILLALVVVAELFVVVTTFNSEDGLGSSALQFTAVIVMVVALTVDSYNTRRYRRQHALLAKGQDAMGENVV